MAPCHCVDGSCSCCGGKMTSEYALQSVRSCWGRRFVAARPCSLAVLVLAPALAHSANYTHAR